MKRRTEKLRKLALLCGATYATDVSLERNLTLDHLQIISNDDSLLSSGSLIYLTRYLDHRSV